MARSSDVARRAAMQSSAIRSDIAKRRARAGGACGDYRGRGAIDLRHSRSYDTAGASRGRPHDQVRRKRRGRRRDDPAPQPLAGESVRVEHDLAEPRRCGTARRHRSPRLRPIGAPRGPDIPPAMGGFLRRLVEEWGLGHPHAVVPDVGTGAVLFAASEDDELFASAVVGSGGASFPLEVTGALQQIIEAVDLGEFEGVDGRDIVARALRRHRATHAARGRSGGLPQLIRR